MSDQEKLIGEVMAGIRLWIGTRNDTTVAGLTTLSNMVERLFELSLFARQEGREESAKLCLETREALEVARRELDMLHGRPFSMRVYEAMESQITSLQSRLAAAEEALKAIRAYKTAAEESKAYEMVRAYFPSPPQKSEEKKEPDHVCDNPYCKVRLLGEATGGQEGKANG